jgi:hypothetical protein
MLWGRLSFPEPAWFRERLWTAAARHFAPFADLCGKFWSMPRTAEFGITGCRTAIPNSKIRTNFCLPEPMKPSTSEKFLYFIVYRAAIPG